MLALPAYAPATVWQLIAVVEPGFVVTGQFVEYRGVLGVGATAHCGV